MHTSILLLTRYLSINGYVREIHTSIDCVPRGDTSTSLLLQDMVCSKLYLMTHVQLFIRPSYLAYGAFGQVASHELTVRLNQRLLW